MPSIVSKICSTMRGPSPCDGWWSGKTVNTLGRQPECAKQAPRPLQMTRACWPVRLGATSAPGVPGDVQPVASECVSASSA
jgi:hypothetical protein